MPRKYIGCDDAKRSEQIDVLVQENVSPLLTHWSYVFLALSHRYIISIAGSAVNTQPRLTE